MNNYHWLLTVFMVVHGLLALSVNAQSSAPGSTPDRPDTPSIEGSKWSESLSTGIFEWLSSGVRACDFRASSVVTCWVRVKKSDASTSRPAGDVPVETEITGKWKRVGDSVEISLKDGPKISGRISRDSFAGKVTFGDGTVKDIYLERKGGSVAAPQASPTTAGAAPIVSPTPSQAERGAAARLIAALRQRAFATPTPTMTPTAMPVDPAPSLPAPTPVQTLRPTPDKVISPPTPPRWKDLNVAGTSWARIDDGMVVSLLANKTIDITPGTKGTWRQEQEHLVLTIDVLNEYLGAEKYIGLVLGDILEVRKDGSRRAVFRAIKIKPGETPEQSIKRLPWFSHTLEQCGFEVAWPDKPGPVKYDALNGLRIATLNAEYNAVCADAREGAGEQYFDTIRNWLLQTFPKLVREEKTKFDKYTGRKGKLQKPTGEVLEYRLYSVGQRVILLSAALPVNGDQGLADKFFASFRLK